ncbi:hypothetical protein K474DRAFT_1579142, partial [Panus rudis PR-1116 ss-1]
LAPYCQFTCLALETPRHVFVVCPTFSSLRALAQRDLNADVDKILDDSHNVLPATLMDRLRLITRHLFSDDARVWPQYSSHYYLGTVPPLPPSCAPLTQVTQIRIVSRVSAAWHIACIRLAGRIWG